MDKNTNTKHLNSNIETIGSNPIGFEDHTAKKEAKLKYRSELENHNIDFHENIDEVIICLAMDHKVKAATIFRRYEKFFNSMCCYKHYLKRPPLIIPMWSAFVNYERGGLNDWEDAMMFKEDIYNWGPQ